MEKFGDKHIQYTNKREIRVVFSNVSKCKFLIEDQIDFEKLSINKRDFFQKMKQAGINLQVHYIPVHLQPFYQKNYGFKQDDFPWSESFYYKVVSLPIYPDLHFDELQYVISKTKEVLKIIEV